MLLSQVHRLRALVLLGRFLDMGAWAVDLALSVGVFPYVLKLLQTTAADLRPTLVFIWTKILACDHSCQVPPHDHTPLLLAACCFTVTSCLCTFRPGRRRASADDILRQRRVARSWTVSKCACVSTARRAGGHSSMLLIMLNIMPA